MRPSGTLRFAIAAALIALTAILLQARSRTEIIPSRLPLSSFPEQLGEWKGTEIPLDKDTLDVLGPGDFLVRDYYAPDQPVPDGICTLLTFPASEPETPSTLPSIACPVPDGTPWRRPHHDCLTRPRPVPGQSLCDSKGDARQLVLYWYLGPRSRRRQRILGQVLSGQGLDSHEPQRWRSGARRHSHACRAKHPDAAEQRLLPFTSTVVPLLDDYIPR